MWELIHSFIFVLVEGTLSSILKLRFKFDFDNNSVSLERNGYS
ncbi:hypothetical protein LEP1GSC021_0242 [Leptospira noguchii str. 1993005606]|nr:hypothetical protein LEP1GSC021_0242 [Leptospira noguchii str. 1993005606]